MDSKIIVNSEWIDKDTYMVNFNPKLTKEDFELIGVTEEVIVEYHKDEGKWIIDKHYYDADGGFIDHDPNAFTDEDKIEYLSMAKTEMVKNDVRYNITRDFFNNGGFKAYSDFRSYIFNYYFDLANGKFTPNEINEIIDNSFLDLVCDLEKKFK